MTSRRDLDATSLEMRFTVDGRTLKLSSCETLSRGRTAGRVLVPDTERSERGAETRKVHRCRVRNVCFREDEEGELGPAVRNKRVQRGGGGINVEEGERTLRAVETGGGIP